MIDAGETVIQVQHLSKSFPLLTDAVHAVNDVSLTIARGEFVSITGHSGSGKSTLLSLIGGLLKPDQGQVIIKGTDLWSLSDTERSQFRNRSIGFVFQFPSLIHSLTVSENILLPSLFRKDFHNRTAEEILEQTGLSDKADRYPHELSGGEQQRVAVARALINNPSILITDEPTGNLDEESEQDIVRLIETMNKQKELTVLLVTHNPVLATRATRNYLMEKGLLRESP